MPVQPGERICYHEDGTEYRIYIRPGDYPEIGDRINLTECTGMDRPLTVLSFGRHRAWYRSEQIWVRIDDTGIYFDGTIE